MNTPPQTISIRVVGDVIVDRHFYDSGVDVFEKSELGGAAGLTRLLQKVIEANGAPAGTTLPLTVAVGFEESRLADIPLTRNAYAVWAPYRQNSKQDAPYVWRAARPMGYGWASEPPEPEFQPKRIEGVTPQILVLDDPCVWVEKLVRMGGRFDLVRPHGLARALDAGLFDDNVHSPGCNSMQRRNVGKAHAAGNCGTDGAIAFDIDGRTAASAD